MHSGIINCFPANCFLFAGKLFPVKFLSYIFQWINSKVLFEFISGNLAEEEEVLQWLITQRTEDRIELITRAMLESMVEETQYLAVYFCK